MDSFALFLYKSSFSLAVFYLFYWLLLRRESWFPLNRMVLGLSLLTAVSLPFIHFTLSPDNGTDSMIYTLSKTFGDGVVVRPDGVLSQPRLHLTFGSTLFGIYLLGVLFFAVRFLIQIFQVIRLVKRYGVTEENGYRIVNINEDLSPFSFFNLIFINTEKTPPEVRTEILKHEWEHIHRMHTLDIVLFEVVCIILWFNPFAWLTKYAIREVHEFEADRSVAGTGESRLNYQKIIIQQAFGHQFYPLVNTLFRNSLIKKRIVMLTREPAKIRVILKSLLILPATMILLLTFSFSENLQKEMKEPPLSIAQQQDTTILEIPDIMPQFEKQDINHFREWVATHLQYPEAAADKNISGRVFVHFTIDPDGKVKDVSIVRGVDSLLDAEAIRVVKSSPDWEPGLKDWKPIPVSFTFPIVFVLDEKKPQDQSGEGEIFFIVEEMPKFQGGDVNKFRTWIAENIRYPEEAVKKGITGKVFVRCIVEADGHVDQVSVIRSADPLLDVEAIRVVKSSPKWTPGRQRGIPVRVAYTFPIVFSLDGHIAKEKTNPTRGEVFFIVEDMPKFQGGDIDKFKQYIADKVEYPRSAVLRGVTGKVFVQWIVDENGNVTDVKVVRGVDPDLDAEAVRVVSSSPGWTPGRQRGVAVRVSITAPINFVLDHQKEPAAGVHYQQPGQKILYFIDGRKATEEEVKKLNADSIKNVSSINGNEAEREYGKEAKDGVIFISTKIPAPVPYIKPPPPPKDPFDKSAGYLYMINGRAGDWQTAQQYKNRRDVTITLHPMNDRVAKKIFGKKAKNGVVFIEEKNK